MDEIDWIKSTKKALILFTKVFGGFAIFFATIALVGSSKSGWEYVYCNSYRCWITCYFRIMLSYYQLIFC